MVDALVAAVRDAYPRLSHRYYALKAKWFGNDALDHWDRNAPLPEGRRSASSRGPRRATTVLDAYGALLAGDGRDRRAASSTSAGSTRRCGRARRRAPSRIRRCRRAHPYVLLNYQGKARDVMTLAHELGHGVHQVLAAPQGALMAPTPLTLAETASVFGEMLTFRALLAETTDPAQRKAMLAAKVEDMINTVVRQIAFYTFERKVHTERREGELTTEQLGEIWMEVQAREPRARRSGSARATRPSGATSRTSSTRPSTSTPMPSATAW